MVFVGPPFEQESQGLEVGREYLIQGVENCYEQ